VGDVVWEDGLMLFPVQAPPGRGVAYASRFDATHEGVDVFADAGSPVLAVESGQARSLDSAKGGRTVYLKTPGGTQYYYAHLEEYVGEYPRSVEEGEVIGTVGTTGNAAGKTPHLHFEVKLASGSKIDPVTLLDAIPGAPKALVMKSPAVSSVKARLSIAPEALFVVFALWWLSKGTRRAV
jgi:murein DD-endopeptidase MepM/ murein hydrolase activator NlpD